MKPNVRRQAASNSLVILGLGSLLVIAILGYLLFFKPSTSPSKPRGSQQATSGATLFFYCAAGIRYPIEQIVERYQQEYGIAVEVSYGGSNTLLSRLEVARNGDLYLAADTSYVEAGRQKGLIAESLPLATMKPVIAVKRGNPKEIRGVEDLLREDVQVALADPEAAAVGKKTRKLLSASGHWPALEAKTRVFQPTVNETVNTLLLDVDAGIVWDSTVMQYPDLEAIEVPELDRGESNVQITVLTASENPTAALRFARFAAAADRGLESFRDKGFQTVEGDLWAEHPELTLFAGAVNRRALEPVIASFAEREGVTVNTKYNGCGILTAEMKSIDNQSLAGFPDTFMACDVYYLETVQELFQESRQVSDTDIVIVVAEGNPKKIERLQDLARQDVRLVLGQPEQCTIGVLSRRLLQGEGVDQLLQGKDIPEKPSSAMLVPDIATGSADATLAYVSDAQSESDRVDVIRLDSPLAKAVQPFSIARSSQQKYLARRLFDALADGREHFEDAGFNWRLDKSLPSPASSSSSSAKGGD